MNLNKIVSLLDPAGSVRAVISGKRAKESDLRFYERRLDRLQAERGEVYLINAGGDPMKAFEKGMRLADLSGEIAKTVKRISQLEDELKQINKACSDES